ncbi:transposable element Tcb2 transposase [Trichonephila clavipes]|nr:transposable element Tcb2 transposase [Trichonephila clavipes]
MGISEIVANKKYQRNLGLPEVSSLGFDNDSKMTEMSLDFIIQITLRVTMPNENRCLEVIPKRRRWFRASCLSCQLSAATGTTVSKQTVNRRLGHIGLYAHRLLRCVLLMAAHCLQRLAWSREHSVDEAHFWLKGYVNKQNCRIWSEANPQVYVETPLHPEKLTIWCALWAGGIIGP